MDNGDLLMRLLMELVPTVTDLDAFLKAFQTLFLKVPLPSLLVDSLVEYLASSVILNDMDGEGFCELVNDLARLLTRMVMK